jgi:hypothetical protein
MLKGKRCIVATHGNCSDGRLGGALMISYLQEQKCQDIQLVFCFYGKDHLYLSPDGDLIFFVDFSPSIESLPKLSEKYSQVVILDHHESFVRELDYYFQYRNITVNADTSCCGAMLVHRVYTSDMSRRADEHEVLFQTNKYDLWLNPTLETFTYQEGCKQLWNNSQSRNIDDLVVYGEDLMDKDYVLVTGKAGMDRKEGDFQKDVIGKMFLLDVPGAGQILNVHCMTEDKNWVCNRMLAMYPHIQFAAVITTQVKDYSISIRGRKGTSILNTFKEYPELAKGHATATGGKITLNQFQAWKKKFIE